MRLILTGGGTAGHVNPALAIAEAVAERERKSEFLFVGRDGGDENRAVAALGIPIATLRVEGLSRSLSPTNIRAAFRAALAVGEAKRLMREFRPDAVVGTGGYVSWPVLRAAISLGVGTALHESNIYPGLVTRMLAGKVDRVLLGSGATLEYLKKRSNARVVGNPLRRGFAVTDRATARRRLGLTERDFFLLSFGGSIGAGKLNEAVLSLMKDFSRTEVSVKHLHGVGKRYFEDVKKAHPDFCRGINGCKVNSYITDMAERMSAADLVICRAGAMTLSELAATGVPSILVPSPNVTDDHQRKNALLYKDGGAAMLVEESELASGRLTEAVRELYRDRTRLRDMRVALSRFAVNDSEERIIRELSEIVRKRD